MLSSIGLAFLFAGLEPLPVSAVTVAVGLPSLLAAWVAVVATRLRGNGARQDLKLQWSWRAAGLGLAFGVGGLFVTIPATLIWVQVVGEGASSSAGEVFGAVHGTWAWAIAVFALVALIGPVCEEIVYRGVLWGALDQRWGRWTALIVTTIVFAVAHFEWTRIPLLLVVALPIGLARLYADNLTASIIAHQVTNLMPGLVMTFNVAGVTMPA